MRRPKVAVTQETAHGATKHNRKEPYRQAVWVINVIGCFQNLASNLFEGASEERKEDSVAEGGCEQV